MTGNTGPKHRLVQAFDWHNQKGPSTARASLHSRPGISGLASLDLARVPLRAMTTHAKVAAESAVTNLPAIPQPILSRLTAARRIE